MPPDPKPPTVEELVREAHDTCQDHGSHPADLKARHHEAIDAIAARAKESDDWQAAHATILKECKVLIEERAKAWRDRDEARGERDLPLKDSLTHDEHVAAVEAERDKFDAENVRLLEEIERLKR